MRPFNARPAWIVSVAAATLLSGVAVEVSARQTAGVVQGVAVDETGAPLAGVEVTARYQSNPGGVSISSRSAVTDGNGRYNINISQPAGTWSIHGSTIVDGIRINLTPDTEALFAGNTGAIRNLRVQYLEQSADSDYGVGGIVQIDQAIGDYSSIAGMQVTLRPAGGGAAITRTIRQTGEGWVATGIKPGTYTVTAQLNGAPMLLTTRGGSNWATSATSRFTAEGFDTRHMRLTVKAAPPGT